MIPAVANQSETQNAQIEKTILISPVLWQEANKCENSDSQQKSTKPLSVNAAL